jgi:hypothetical protein
VTAAEPSSMQRDGMPSPFGRFVCIVLIFLFLGPPIGGITVWAMSLGTELWRGREVFPGAAPAFFYFAIFAYPLGAPFAFASGVIHAVAAIWLRMNSILVPLVTSCAVNVVGLALYAWLQPWLGRAKFELLGGLWLFLPPSLVASLACWRMTRPFARAA